MFRRSLSILRILASIFCPMYSPMSAGRRMSTWLAGRNTGTPMSTSSPPLILRVTLPLDDVAFLVLLDDPLPAADAVGLALGEHHQAAVALDLLQQHLDLLADLDGAGVVELAEVDGAFALEAHLDDHVVADDADDAPGQHRPGLGAGPSLNGLAESVQTVLGAQGR